MFKLCCKLEHLGIYVSLENSVASHLNVLAIANTFFSFAFAVAKIVTDILMMATLKSE